MVWQNQCGAELYIDRGQGSEADNEKIFDQLLLHRTDIEKTFAGLFNWERLEGKRACRIGHVDQGGGYRSPEETWPDVQDNCWSNESLG